MTAKQRYDKSVKGRETNRRAVHKYTQSAKGKRTRKLYQQTKGKEAHRLANAKYRASFGGHLCRKFYRKNLTIKERTRAIQALLNFKGMCDCCGGTQHKGRNWHLDHKNRKFRGILCSPCNLAAGLLTDSIKRCIRLIKYLRKNNV
jgi:hypothetical protein